MPTTMTNQSEKAPTVDLQALLTRAKDIPIDTTPMPTIKPSLADSLQTLQSQVAQIMTVQLEKFEEIVGVVNSMKAGYKQLDNKVGRLQTEMKVLKEKLAENKVDKIQADQMALQERLEEVVCSVKKLEECQESDVDSEKDSESDELEEVDTDPRDKSKTDSTGAQPIGETASIATPTDESDKKSRENVLNLNKQCNSGRGKIYPLLNEQMEETERIFPGTLAKLGHNTSRDTLRRLMSFYNLPWSGQTSFEMQHIIASHIGIPQAVREKYLVRPG